jgi:hypothetical protein
MSIRAPIRVVASSRIGAISGIAHGGQPGVQRAEVERADLGQRAPGDGGGARRLGEAGAGALRAAHRGGELATTSFLRSEAPSSLALM